MRGKYVVRVIKYAILQLVVAIFIILWLTPLYAMLVGGFKPNMEAASAPILLPPSQFSTEAYYFDWFGFGTLIGLEFPMIRQLIITVPVALASVIFGSMVLTSFICKWKGDPGLVMLAFQ